MLHGHRKNFMSHLISRKPKMTFSKVLVKPVATYASETWTFTKADERVLGIFEINIVRSTFEAVRYNGQCRRR
jgi:hypothetical protein